MPLTLNQRLSLSFFQEAQMVTNGIVPPKQIKDESEKYRWRVEINFLQITFHM